MATTQHFILATAGHVDHGKSSLVKALTGTDPDRLPEEKARGITIDLGFAHLELPAPQTDNQKLEVRSGKPETQNPKPETFSVGIVDVPGHEDFVTNMVAGVGSIDLALFIVAADDGWMPQTEEHLQILSYLGVNRAVVALTKIDLLPDRIDSVMAAIQSQLAESPFAAAEIVPTSVITNHGLSDLKAALARALALTRPGRDLGKPRLPVDRVFTLRGIGTVVTGTLSGGSLRRGQAVVVQPSGRAARIRTLQSHGLETDVCGPGMRTALNLPDATAQGEASEAALKRGDVITLSELGGAHDTLDVLLEKSPRLRNGQSIAARPLKDGALVRIHHGSGHFTARVALIEVNALEPGQRAIAQLRFEAPFYAFMGDRFVVRDWSEQWTVAGGIILELATNRRFLRGDVRKRFLWERANAPDDVHAFVQSELKRTNAQRRDRLLVRSRFSREEINSALDVLMQSRAAVAQAEWIIEASWWQSMLQRAAGAIDTEHRDRPQSQGLALNGLRDALLDELPAPELFERLTADLCRADFVQVGTVIRRRTHRPALPPNLQAAGMRLRAVLAAKPFDPPSRKELAQDKPSEQALRFLLETHETTQIGDDVVVLTESYDRMTRIVRDFLRERGRATASELRQAIGGSRRIVIPLLERLDREGVTRREGDVRVLKAK
ncbi:MAG: SelB C-terminal domain-containing protein [Verrucomicrobiales bacterium]|nr:SelB C-terminal domain-containing protein [Verrucomicrobiales bacterium]